MHPALRLHSAEANQDVDYSLSSWISLTLLHVQAAYDGDTRLQD
jgi:hypothetical protein